MARLTDRDITKVAAKMIDWKELSPFLGLKLAQDREVELSSISYAEQKRAMLRKWRDRKGRFATYEALAAALRNACEWKLAEYVEEITENSNEQPKVTQEPPVVVPNTRSGAFFNQHVTYMYISRQILIWCDR